MIGEETKRQILEGESFPDAVIAAVGGSNAIGMFADFIDEIQCAFNWC